VLDIAQRAGLAKSTFFRHFPDKRAVLFGEDPLTGPLVAAITAAPAAATALEAVARGLDALGRDIFTAERHAFVARRRAVIDAHADLQEREALKGLHLTAALTRAVTDRGVPALAAEVAAQLGALALATAYERWIEAGGTEEFGTLARQALDAVRSAASGL
jgi:AcrR family transcriptional regulator